jgi:hypothetical protein
MSYYPNQQPQIIYQQQPQVIVQQPPVIEVIQPQPTLLGELCGMCGMRG